jgi:hypothetical protein
VVLWAVAGSLLASHAQRTRAIDVGDRRSVAELVGDRRGGALGGIRGSGLSRWSTVRRAWLPWQGLWRSGEALTMRPAAGVSPTAADRASTAAWSCLVVVGGSSAPLPPGGSQRWPTSVLGVAAEDSSTSLWSVAASSSTDEVYGRVAAWGPTDLRNKCGCPRVLLLLRW